MADAIDLYKPVGHAVFGFPAAEPMEAAAAALQSAGFDAGVVRRWTDQEMAAALADRHRRIGVIESIGHEVRILETHLKLAQQGHHWLTVHLDDNEAAGRAAAAVLPEGPSVGRYYGSLVLYELFDVHGATARVAQGPELTMEPVRNVEPEAPAAAPIPKTAASTSSSTAGAMPPEATRKG